MELSTLLLAVLFIAGLINIFFYLPTNKITASPSSTPTKEVKSDVYKKQELTKVFSTFDKNGDGFITKQELRESLRNIRIFMTETEVDEVVTKYDSNGDGLIDFEEFCMLIGECMGEDEEKENEGVVGNEDEEQVNNLKEAFDVFDKDNDGLISVEELALVLTSLGLREGKKIEECKEMIKKVDLDGDGMVNFNEFKRMMASGGKLLFAA